MGARCGVSRTGRAGSGFRLAPWCLLVLLAGSMVAAGAWGGQTPSVPAAPSNLVATAVSSMQINVSWQDNSFNELGFELQRRTLNGTFQPVAQTGPNQTTFIDTDVVPGVTYVYRVRAFNEFGFSAFSNEFSATPPSPGQQILSAIVRVFRGSQLVARGRIRVQRGEARFRVQGLRPGRYRADAVGFATPDFSGPVVAVADGIVTVLHNRTAVLHLAWRSP